MHIATYGRLIRYCAESPFGWDPFAQCDWNERSFAPYGDQEEPKSGEIDKLQSVSYR